MTWLKTQGTFYKGKDGIEIQVDASDFAGREGLPVLVAYS
jgi:hypothetical protein